MNHQTYREWIPLFLYEELNPEQSRELSAHLKECESCSAQLRELEMVQAKLESAPTLRPSEDLLQEARAELRVALRMERSKTSLLEKISGRLNFWTPYLKFAAGAAAMMIVGILVGRYAFAPETNVVTQTVRSRADILRGDVQISNVKFEDADAKDGNVAFSFDTVTPMQVRGSINDPQIQKVLTYAALNSQNPGTRLRAVNALSTERLRSPDQDIKRALIQSLKTDENPGVRKEALTALQKFPVDQEIKDALLHVLVHEGNAGMRVDAIKCLESQRTMVDAEVLSVLKDRSQSDEVEGVRWKARELLQEVTQVQ